VAILRARRGRSFKANIGKLRSRDPVLKSFEVNSVITLALGSWKIFYEFSRRLYAYIVHKKTKVLAISFILTDRYGM
jgi:hypothetical protein